MNDINRTQMEYLNKKCNTALDELYTNNNVGKSIKDRCIFWDNKYPDTHITHIKTKKERVAVMEFTWLVDKFPKDFVVC
jgi:hypothetical protein